MRSYDRNESVAALVTEAGRKDNALAERHRAYSELVMRFQDMAFSCAFALLGDYQLAEDAAQEAFLSAYQRLDQLREPTAFPGWLQQIVRTQCHRKIRHSQFTLVTLNETLDERLPAAQGTDSSADQDPEASALRRERTREVQAALAGLPERERLVTVLFYVREYSRAEVAQFLGISLASVKKRLSSARARLKERLIDMIQEDLHEQRPSNSLTFATRLMAFTKLFNVSLWEGKSLVRSLADLSTAEEDSVFRAVIDDVNRDIQEGSSLSRAMARHPDCFSAGYVAAIRTGEVLGRLDAVLYRLANGSYFENSVRRFTPACSRVYAFAIAEAIRRPNAIVRWEHLLLGILQQSECGAVRTLANIGVDIARLRAAAEARIDTYGTESAIYRFDASVVQMDTRLDDEAHREGKDHIDTHILLLQLFDTAHEIGEAQLFEDAGITLDRLRSAPAANDSPD